MNFRKLAAIAAVLTMMTSAVSCGKDSDDGGSADTTAAVTVDGTDGAAEKSTTGVGFIPYYK